MSESKVKPRQERTLKGSEDLYHKMVDEVEDYAILSLDKEGNILNWNKGAQKIKGYTEEEILGKNFRIFYQEKDRSEKLPEQHIKDAKIKGKAMHEGWRLRKDGSKFWGSIVITALHDDYNNVIGFSKVTRDLTERKLTEDKLRQYNRDIELQNKQLEEYAYIASHDLQEPLRKIQIFASLLEKNIGDRTEVQKNIAKINASAKRMTNLIKDILNYSRLILTDELFETVNLKTMLNDIMEDFELLISERKALIKYADMPVVNGIPIQLNQLFSNLISNAIKFTEGQPVIHIQSEKLSEAQFKEYPQLTADNAYTLITFQDNGIGFDSQYKDRIFKLFQRLDNSTNGNGIGLALCKRIVENHRGLISVSSEVNKGTAFTIILPLPEIVEGKHKKGH